MKVLLHHESTYSPPTGIWWWDAADGTARSSYLPAAPAGLDARGRQRLDVVANRNQFDAAHERLGSRTPHSDDWTATEISDAWDPESALAAFNRAGQAGDAAAEQQNLTA